MNRRLIEPRIHYQRHELHALCVSGCHDVRINASCDHAEAVDDKDLRRDDRDLVGVREKALCARLTADRVPQRLDLLRCPNRRPPNEEQTKNFSSDRRSNHSSLAASIDVQFVEFVFQIVANQSRRVEWEQSEHELDE